MNQNQMGEYLISIGLNIASSVIYDVVKSILAKGVKSREEFRDKISAALDMNGADIYAEKIISFLAENGDIIIENSKIYAKDSITLASSINTEFIIGNNSISKTDKTRIDAGNGAFIKGQGGATVKQNEDGIISFIV